MKIYILIEGKIERIIRGVTLSRDIASNICGDFSYLNLAFEEYETIENVELRNLLDGLPPARP